MPATLVGFAFTQAALAYLATIPPKLRAQVVKKARALHLDPRPRGATLLKGVTTACGDRVYRQRSGDYRILYVVRDNPGEVIILDIDHRKDVYR